MAEYRDVEPLKNQIAEFKMLVESSENSDYLKGYITGIDAVMEAIDEQPSADVQEVKHGHWKQRMSTLTSVKCSECGTYHEYDTRYCPHCGARMDGEENAKTNLRKP